MQVPDYLGTAVSATENDKYAVCLQKIRHENLNVIEGCRFWHKFFSSLVDCGPSKQLSSHTNGTICEGRHRPVPR